MTNMVLKAFVDEYNCIGCSKCIRVCPTDAIVGAKKMLHTILPYNCTSCGNCVDACPTNCISLTEPGPALSPADEAALTERKTLRLQRKAQVISAVGLFTPEPTQKSCQVDAAQQRKQSVADAIARVKARKQAELKNR